jgi:hypothetical protein
MTASGSLRHPTDDPKRIEGVNAFLEGAGALIRGGPRWRAR